MGRLGTGAAGDGAGDGSGHPDTLRARANLAFSFWRTGRFIDAIVLEEHVLADSERILGSEHPDTLSARVVLGEWTGGGSAR